MARMVNWAIGIVAGAGLVTAAAVGWAAEAPAPVASSELKSVAAAGPNEASSVAASAAEVEALIGQLSSRAWRDRERAATRLAALGPAVYDRLIAAYKRTRQFETRLRIKRIVADIFVAARYPAKTGFLGITQSSLMWAPPGSTEKKRTAIKVSSVLRGSAAERAGLQAGDLIIQFNGKNIPNDPTGRAFSKMVGDLEPNGRVEMKVVRGAQQGTVTVVLGTRPMQHQPGTLRADVRKAWNAWWKQYLDEQTPAATTQPVP